MSSLIVNTNVQSLNSHRALKVNSNSAEKSSEKLSSGMRINRAGDDAAGLAISEKMRNQIKGLNMASRNSQDGISMIQTAEGALQETHEILKRMRELVVQAGNDTNVSSDRAKIATELGQLICEITAMTTKTEYNNRKLVNGDAQDLHLQVGANKDQSIVFDIDCMSTGVNGLNLPKDAFEVDTFKKMPGADITKLTENLDAAIERVSTQRANLGALQNRLEHTIKNLDTAAENLSASESRIRDTDMAKEMMEFTKSNVLQQAGMNMLSQANQAPNNVLSLLR